MSDSVSRRDWLKTVGAASASAMVAHDVLRVPAGLVAEAVPPAPPPPYATGDIVDLVSTSQIFIPPRGRAFQKFSYDFPEPSVAFGEFTFGFLVFTDENTYGLDRSRLTVAGNADTLTITCNGFVWAGGQETAHGSLTATLRRKGDAIEWDAVAHMPDHPIKTVTSIVRGVPRGQISTGAGAFSDQRDNEVLAAYTFGGGDLNGPGGSMSTPLLMIQQPAGVFYVTTLDDRVRPKRFYLAPGETSYRVEAIYEHDAWRNDHDVTVPTWRLGRAATADEAIAAHMAHIESAFGLRTWESRTDVPAWMRDIALVTTLHGMHYTGYMFNDYPKMLETLKWMATQIPGNRVLVFVSAWDGRYYWDYPNYKPSDRMGGEAGFRKLVDGAHAMGFKIMPMYGTNAANTKQPVWSRISDAVVHKIDGNVYNLDWVDWNNDRHQDGWLAYMNLGADAWRDHLTQRIDEMISRYHVDAYFLDIVGGHVNSTNGDMHEGTRRMVTELRAKYPNVACVGEMPYDALHGFIPMFQVGLGRWSRYSRNYSHLSSPAPGRGSSGVHESGFGRFNTETLGLYPSTIPTLQVVDDTFAKYKDVMAAVIKQAKQRAGIA